MYELSGSLVERRHHVTGNQSLDSATVHQGSGDKALVDDHQIRRKRDIEAVHQGLHPGERRLGGRIVVATRRDEAVREAGAQERPRRLVDELLPVDDELPPRVDLPGTAQRLAGEDRLAPAGRQDDQHPAIALPHQSGGAAEHVQLVVAEHDLSQQGVSQRHGQVQELRDSGRQREQQRLTVGEGHATAHSMRPGSVFAFVRRTFSGGGGRSVKPISIRIFRVSAM